ncbi:MAG: oligopeptide transporter, OPT family [Succinivibrio sp.]|nr:oligopeptide transporter, OPT family [Succinivibrio sp.]
MTSWEANFWSTRGVADNPEDLAIQLWAQKIRFAGAGCIAIAALWTLVTLFGSIVRGLKESLEISRQAREESVSPQDTDLHIKELTAATLLALLLLAGVLYSFAAASTLSAGLIVLCVITGTLLTAIIGFVLAAACGYMAGLVGSSSSPISGITIISVVLIAVVFMLLSQVTDLMQTPGTRAFITAFTLFTATAVTASCCIANDNLQDLKTGQLVGASPRLQQIALIIGTALGALVIAPVLDLLYQSYGFTGALPRADMDPSLVLSAPQATLMSSIVGGIFNRDLDWFYIGMGLLLGAVIIVISMLLQKYSKGRLSLAPLAVGLGIYLPSDVNVMIVVGALISYLLGRSLQQRQKTALQALRERSNLLAAGLIVGESLIGVILAIVLTVSTASGGSASPLALESPLSAQSTQVISLVCFVAGCVYALRLAVRTPRQGA